MNERTLRLPELPHQLSTEPGQAQAKRCHHVRYPDSLAGNRTTGVRNWRSANKPRTGLSAARNWRSANKPGTGLSARPVHGS